MFEAFFKRPLIVQVLALIVAVIPLASFTAMAAPPAIRLSASNQVPACVTPSRLMAFLATRNKRLNPNFREIAEWYRYHGESWQVRWDYAFYQMAIETNFLTYRAPNAVAMVSQVSRWCNLGRNRWQARPATAMLRRPKTKPVLIRPSCGTSTRGNRMAATRAPM